ncbi:MAG: hypothetical protein OXC64_05575 [Flavobacteriaceae bacterium]|nr:hypothetical protein [Flavobacteriaceae bacterium]
MESSISQTGTVSPYSFAGLGEQNFRGTQVTRFMGGLDVYSDSIHVNLNNPAAYGKLKFTTYSLGINYNTNLLSSGDDNTTLNGASIDYLSIGIPTKRFGFGFGIIPLTSVGYEIASLEESENGKFDNQFEGSGGVNQAFFSVGLPIFREFRIGATGFYNFGSIDYSRSLFIEGVDIASYSKESSKINGWSYQFTSEFDIALFEQINLSGLFSFQPQANLNSENLRVYYTRKYDWESYWTNLISENRRVYQQEGTVEDFNEFDLGNQNLDKTEKILPQTFKIGIGLGQKQKWFVGTQVNLLNFDNFKSEFPMRDNVTYQDARQWIIGGFYIPDYSSLTSYFSRIVYRLGFRTENLGVLIDGQSLRLNVISFGFGLPVQGLSNANIGLEIGSSGKNQNGLVAHSSVALRVGLSLNDLWFIKRKYN